jgi:hypothetical protein
MTFQIARDLSWLFRGFVEEFPQKKPNQVKSWLGCNVCCHTDSAQGGEAEKTRSSGCNVTRGEGRVWLNAEITPRFG